MAEVVCASASFTVKIKVAEADLIPQVEILESTPSADEGDHITADVRITNIGSGEAEIDTLDLMDSSGVIEHLTLATGDNISPGKFRDYHISTLGWSKDMPADDWALSVKVCFRQKGWI